MGFNLEYLLWGLLITLISYMIVPFFLLMVNGGYEEKKAKKIALWNSIIVGGIYMILTLELMGESSTWNAAPAYFYYVINCSFLKKERKKGVAFEDDDTIEEQTFWCGKCDSMVSETDDVCPNCGATFTEEDDSNNNSLSEEETFMCDECGSMVSETDDVCPNCGATFTEEDDSNNNSLSEEEPKQQKKQSNCAESSTKKKDVVKKENFDVKYDNLIKLKKLYDDKILTKEEFEHEKSKILENNE